MPIKLHYSIKMIMSTCWFSSNDPNAFAYGEASCKITLHELNLMPDTFMISKLSY